MDEEAESSSRTSARLKGRSHPKIYISEDDDIQEIPNRQKSTSSQCGRKKPINVSLESFMDRKELYPEFSGFVNDYSPDVICDEYCKEEPKVQEFDVPSSLAAIFSNIDPNPKSQQKKRTVSRVKSDEDSQEKRILKILDSIPSHKDMEANPNLRELAKRKPYSERISSKLAKRPPSPKLDLNQLPKRESRVPPPTDKKGITLTSMPIDKSDKKYTRIKCNDEPVQPEVKVEWPGDVNDMLSKYVEKQHECKMVEFMTKTVSESKKQARLAWESVRETLQKVREKEVLIRQLRNELYHERHAAGFNESLMASLKEGRITPSYSSLPLHSRQNAQGVFRSVLHNAFPNFNELDMKRIFQDIITSANRINSTTTKQPVFISNTPKEISTSISTGQTRTIKIKPLSQKISTMSPLAVISNSAASTSTTPQLLPKRPIMVLAKHHSVDSTKFKLKPTLEQERRILKIHPPIQYASPPEKARFLKNNVNSQPKEVLFPVSKLIQPTVPDSLDSNEIDIPRRLLWTFFEDVPNGYCCNLCGDIFKGTRYTTVARRHLNSRKHREEVKERIEAYLKERAPRTPTKIIRRFPNRPPMTTHVQLSTKSTQNSNRRILKAPIPITTYHNRLHIPKTWQIPPESRTIRTFVLPQRLPSNSSLRATADATERAQEENKRRLEALLPVKLEPVDTV